MRQEFVKMARLERRRHRVRRRILGTPLRPRLSVSRSHRNICAQLIDDLAGRTLCSVSSLSEELRRQCPYGGNIAAAALVGKALAEKARTLGIEQVCFDRNGRMYHGRVKALAEAVRQAGLKL